MSDQMTFDFELVDKASGPAARIYQALEKVTKSIDKATHGLEHLKKTSKESMEGFFLGSLLERGFEKATESVKELISKVVELGAELGKELVHAADFERSTGIAFKALLGSAEGAEMLVDDAKKFSMAMGVGYDQTVKLYQQLLLAGSTPVNIPILLQAATDVGKLTGEGPERMIESFRRILSEKAMTGRDLMPLKGIVNFDILSKKLGFSAHNAKELMQQLNNTPINADRGITAILQTLAAMEGGKLGQVTSDIGGGFEGMLTKMKNGWDIFLGDFEKTEAFKSILFLMGQIVEMMDPTTKKGQEFKHIFEDLFTSIGDAIRPLTTPDGLRSFLETLRDIAKVLGTIASAFAQFGGQGVKGFTDLGQVITGKGKGGKSLSAFERFNKLMNDATDIGYYPDAGDQEAGVEDNVVAPTKKALKIHSPSKVFREIGRMSALGYQLGMDDVPMPEGIAYPDVKPVGGKASGGSRQLHVGSITVQVTGTTGMDAEALKTAVKEGVLDAMNGAYEELAIEAGGV